MSVYNTLNRITSDTARVQFEQGQENLGTGQIDKNAFLNLLLTQLQHQDPTNPMENNEFIQQQAAFTQIEKLDALIDATSASNAIGQASSMVGQNVELVLDDGSSTYGRIDSVEFGAGGAIGLHVGDQIYSMGQVGRIFADS